MQSHDTNSTNPEFVRNPGFKIVRNYEELKASLDETTICGILTIEGMHALGEYKKEHLFNQQSIDDLDQNDRDLLEKSFINNIAVVKGKDDVSVVAPYFITFAHHFNNLIAGHAKSFKDGQFIKPGFSDVFDQTKGQDRGLTEFAKNLIVNHLFSRHNGSRILVDTKHMSLNSRDDYFKLVSAFNRNNPNDIVPIIVSHTAVNGLKDRATARQTPDKNGTEKNSYVSRWDINLTDQDIEEVFATNGLIGVCMHDGRMPGDNFKKLFRQQKGQVDFDESIMRLHSQMFLTNIFHVVKVTLNYIRQLNSQGQAISEKNAWNTLSLGSDNDGIVDPFDNYNSADFLLDFKLRAMRSIEQNHKPFFKTFKILSLPDEKPFSQEQLADLMQGFTAEELVDKIFSDNTDAFLSIFFTKDYLTTGTKEALIV
jgi:microsomal dipeptidase-like Zn-dependent dipeptidase